MGDVTMVPSTIHCSHWFVHGKRMSIIWLCVINIAFVSCYFWGQCLLGCCIELDCTVQVFDVIVSTPCVGQHLKLWYHFSEMKLSHWLYTWTYYAAILISILIFFYVYSFSLFASLEINPLNDTSKHACFLIRPRSWNPSLKGSILLYSCQ